MKITFDFEDLVEFGNELLKRHGVNKEVTHADLSNFVEKIKTVQE